MTTTEKCRDRDGQFEAHEWDPTECDGYGNVTMFCYECDQEYTLDVGFENYGDEIRFKGSLWDAREHIEPPAEDFVMFADSCPTTNVCHLLNEGHSPEDICVVRIGYAESVWVYQPESDE